MSSKINDIHQRRGQLLERIANQRVALSAEWQPVQKVLVKTDRVWAYSKHTVEFAQKHLGLCLAAASILVIMKPRACWRWAQRSFIVWRLWQGASAKFAFLSRFLP